jgi:hypothetical protein
MAGADASSTKFFNMTQDLLLMQLVTEATRMRQGQEPSVLDYIFTDEQNLTDIVHYEAPLGKSDHVVLKWELTLYVAEVESKQYKLNYWKGN